MMNDSKMKLENDLYIYLSPVLSMEMDDEEIKAIAVTFTDKYLNDPENGYKRQKSVETLSSNRLREAIREKRPQDYADFYEMVKSAEITR